MCIKFDATYDWMGIINFTLLYFLLLYVDKV